MKNVTISMDEELLRQVRIKAAERGVSVSRHLCELARRDTIPTDAGVSTEQTRQQRIFAEMMELAEKVRPYAKGDGTPITEEDKRGDLKDFSR